MMDVILHEKNESMLFAIRVVLLLYCDYIYNIAHEFHDTALVFVENDECVKHAFQVHIHDLIDDFDYYKQFQGAGSEKLEDIDIIDLKNKVILAHKQAVKAFVLKNLEANIREEENGSEYWKLKIVNNPNIVSS